VRCRTELEHCSLLLACERRLDRIIDIQPVDGFVYLPAARAYAFEVSACVLRENLLNLSEAQRGPQPSGKPGQRRSAVRSLSWWWLR